MKSISKTKEETEQKIKRIARQIFQQKGFSATKTRDIAEAANINLALLNYYFRSKKKLYDLIMMETIHTFFSDIMEVANNETTTLKEKIQLLVERYIDMLSANPDMVVFILNEVREHPKDFIDKIGILERAKGSVFIKQFQQEVNTHVSKTVSPIHFMINLAGMVIFPFIAAPMVTTLTGMKREKYIALLQERKLLIPFWMETMLSKKINIPT